MTLPELWIELKSCIATKKQDIKLTLNLFNFLIKWFNESEYRYIWTAEKNLKTWIMIAVIYTTSSVVKVCEICEIDSLPLENKFNKVKDTYTFRVTRSSGGGR